VNIEFSKGLSYSSCCTPSSLLVMFVRKAKSSVRSSNHHAPGLANTAPLLLRDSSHSLRRKGPVAAFGQPAGTSPLVIAIPADVATQRRLSSLILAQLDAVRAGRRRLNKTEIRPYHGPFLSWRGLSRFPDPSTLRRFLKRRSPRSVPPLVTLHDPLRAQLFTRPRRRTPLTFDSVVLTV
jgi:hypothetical protein